MKNNIQIEILAFKNWKSYDIYIIYKFISILGSNVGLVFWGFGCLYKGWLKLISYRIQTLSPSDSSTKPYHIKNHFKISFPRVWSQCFISCSEFSYSSGNKCKYTVLKTVPFTLILCWNITNRKERILFYTFGICYSINYIYLVLTQVVSNFHFIWLCKI